MFDSSKITFKDDDWVDRFERDNKTMRMRSGNVTTTSRLVVFLYLLMRDVVPSGDVEQRVSEACIAIGREGEVLFTNGYLANHASDIAARLDNQILQGVYGRHPLPPPTERDKETENDNA